MKIINICSNYGSYKDGIGAYSKNIVNEMKKIDNKIYMNVISPNIDNYNKFQRIISLKMSKSCIQAIKLVKEKQYDIVNIEYPFTEWNPVIIYFYKKLYKICKKTNTKMSLSLHEYERVNPLRKRIIEQMVKYASFVFVTSEITKNNLLRLNKKIYIRDIPSNIHLSDNIDLLKKNINLYVFFGLVNKNKAFEEMISGWKKFYNINNNAKLVIITSSDISVEEKYGISVQKKLNDEEIETIMSNSMYAILPIKPNVSYNNATLKTATMFGTIPIGKFSKEIKKENKVFYLNVDNYDEDSFFNILKDTQDIKEEDLKNMQEKSIEFGKKYNISNIAKSIYDVYLENIKEKR